MLHSKKVRLYLVRINIEQGKIVALFIFFPTTQSVNRLLFFIPWASQTSIMQKVKKVRLEREISKGRVSCCLRRSFIWLKGIGENSNVLSQQRSFPYGHYCSQRKPCAFKNFNTLLFLLKIRPKDGTNYLGKFCVSTEIDLLSICRSQIPMS